MKAKENKIKAVINITSSRGDMYGNRYHYATVTRTLDGASITGMIDAPCNIRIIVRQAVNDDVWESITYSERELPIREFNKSYRGLTKTFTKPEDIINGWNYAAYLEGDDDPRD